MEQILYRLKIRDPEAFRNIRPEESMGIASVAELKAAEANIMAAMQGQMPPSPPEEGQQHPTRIGAYQSAKQLLAIDGKVNQILEQLIQLQAQVAEAETTKTAPRPNSTLKAPSVQSI